MNDIFYDSNSTSIEDSIKTIGQLDGKRFRIFMDIVSSCFGNCSGCALSFTARKDTTPDMTIANVREYLGFFIPLINKKVEENGLFTSVVNFGTGDYFTMEQEFLEYLFKETSDFFKQIKTKRNVMTISTSLFMKPEKMKPKIESIQKYLKGNQFAVDAVIDPTILNKNFDNYLANYKMIKKDFPFFDLVVNISNHVSENDIKNLMKFFKELNLLSFDVQYALNKTNTYRVKVDKEKFKELMYVIENEATDKETLLGYNLAIPSAKEDDNKTIFEQIKGHAKEIVSERFAVKGNGDIYPIAFGYGDIILDEKYDMPRIGNIKDGIFNEEKAMEIIESYLINVFRKNKVCHTCEYSSMCYSTGYSFYNKFSHPKECENVGLYIFEGIKNKTWLSKIGDFKK